MDGFKNELNTFLQKYCKRPLLKNDIEYTTSKFGSQYQSVVKLNCLQGQEYAGHLCHDQKTAEKSAAQQALTANDSLVQEVKIQGPTEKKRSSDMTPAERAEKKARQELDGNPSITPKTELNSLVMRIVKRYLKKGETIYVSNKIGNGTPAQYQATVQVSGLPGDWANRAWAGQLCSTKQHAEQSAAEQALTDIKADPTLMEEAAKPKGGGKGKGKGKGKGNGKGGGNWWDMMGMMMMEAMSWSGGWGGKGGGSGERERVNEEDYVGTILEWKGSFGWLQTPTEIDHPSSKKRNGKIYIHKKDIETCPETIAEGQTIKFKLYADGSGLGAEEASLI